MVGKVIVQVPAAALALTVVVPDVLPLNITLPAVDPTVPRVTAPPLIVALALPETVLPVAA